MQRPSGEDESKSTYVIDAESLAEQTRLTYQSQVVTRYMGGPVPTVVKIPRDAAVLDVACGPGEWVLSLASEFPESAVVGIDISTNSIKYAIAQGKAQGRANATFRVMNVTESLAFPDAAFDFVNGRFLIGFMKPTAWDGFVKECRRVTRPGGYICLTEFDTMSSTTSAAFEQLWIRAALAFKQAGRSFSPAGHSFNITPRLGKFLIDAGYSDIHTIPYVIDYSTGTDAHESIFQDWLIGLKLLLPFLELTGNGTMNELEQLYTEAVAEMIADDFRALWYFTSVIGQRPA